MSSWLSEREQRLVAGAETASAATPIPTQIVSNGEYLPPPQSETQKRVERRILELADANSKRLGLSRRQFMQTGCGMAAAFIAMNEIHGGSVFQVAAAEAREPELLLARTQDLAGQFVFDVQTHFVRDDFDHARILGLARFAAEHWNPKLEGASSLVRYKFHNYVKEIYYDSDTSLALLSGAPFDDPSWWFLSNEQIVGRARSSTISRARGDCSRTPSSRPSNRAGWRRSTRRSPSTSRIRGSPTPSATRARRRSIRGGSTTSR